jgi:hypothetical protein
VGPKAGEVLPLLRTRFGLSSIEDLLALKTEQLQENLTVDLGHVVSFFIYFSLILVSFCLIIKINRKTGDMIENKKDIHMDTPSDVRRGVADDFRGQFLF